MITKGHVFYFFVFSVSVIIGLRLNVMGNHEDYTLIEILIVSWWLGANLMSLWYLVSQMVKHFKRRSK